MILTTETYKDIEIPPPQDVVRFALSLTPKAIQSVRFSARGGYVQTFQPKANKQWKLAVKTEVAKQLPVGWEPFHDVPLSVDTVYIFPPLKSFNKAQRLKIASGGWILKQTKPDVNDNLNKGLFDALTGVLWDDDARVAQAHALKVYGGIPGILITVGILPEM